MLLNCKNYFSMFGILAASANMALSKEFSALKADTHIIATNVKHKVMHQFYSQVRLAKIKNFRGKN